MRVAPKASPAVSKLRKLLENERSRDRRLRASLEKLTARAPQGFNDIFTAALEERDRQMADLQREADERAAEIKEITAQADRRFEELKASNQEAAGARAEAERRYELLVSANETVERLDALLRERNTAIEALYSQIASLQDRIAGLESGLELQAPPQPKAEITGLNAQIHSLQTQLAIVTQAAEERLVALEQNAQAVADLRSLLVEKERALEKLREASTP
jgi:chromosome segregation ATPase